MSQSRQANSGHVTSPARLAVASRFWRWLSWSLLMPVLLLGCQVLFGGVEVTHKTSSLDSCATGDVRCNDEYLLVCGSGAVGWTLMDTCASGDLCDAKDKRCAVCKAGDARCDGAMRELCAADGSKWQTVETCTAANLCSVSSCTGCSTDGALDCSQGTDLRQCQGGVWVTRDTCVSQNLCNATMDAINSPDVADAGAAGESGAAPWDGKCKTPGCPVAGQYRCDGTILERCPPAQDDWVKVDTCASEALCANIVAGVNGATDPNAVSTLDSCPAGCPTAGATMCDGPTLQKCRPDQTGYDVIAMCGPGTECDPVAADCGALCTAGQYQCNGATLRKCSGTGHWMDQSACETAALCVVSADGTSGSCTPSPCGNNPFTCNGATLQKCKDDRTGYTDSETCASVPLCDANSARCITPTCTTAGAYRCFGQDLEQCAPDLTKWNEVTTCPTGQLCNSQTNNTQANPNCLTSCPANPLRCNGNVLEHCAAATGWTTQATCSTADLCTCALTDPDGSGPLTNSCAAGLYKDGCGNVLCGKSLANYQCQGNELQKCQAGRNGWDNVSACGAAQYTPYQSLCYAGTAPTYTGGYCLTCPVAGEAACSGNALQVCSNDRSNWNTSQTCANGCVVQQGGPAQGGNDYCAACAANALRCSGAQPQACSADRTQWANKGAACASAALCNNAKATCTTPICTPNQTTCNGAQPQICNTDQTAYGNNGKACASAALCSGGTCTPPPCTLNQKRCSGAQPQICSTDLTGYINNGVACASAALCSGGTCTPPPCTLNQKRCSGAQPQICSTDLTGYINNGVACASAALCSGGTCTTAPCTPNEKRCSGAQPQICNSDLTGYINNGMACATAALCDGTTFSCDMPICAVGQQQCSGTHLQTCNADRTGYTQPGTDCGAAGCNSTTMSCNTVICTPNAFTCSGQKLQQCNATGTVNATIQTCTASQICDAAGAECDDCVAPQFNCLGNVLQTCSASGHWVNTDCLTNVCDATQGTCDVPPDQ